MTTTRREFIRNTALAGTGVMLHATSGFGRFRGSGRFLEKIGACTSVTNSKLFEEAGFSYIEEGVRSFLVPQEDERTFAEKLALARNASLPVEACNSFLPGELKCVGPDAVPDEILKFAATAFRRAETAGIKTIVFGSGASRKIPEGFSREKAERQFVELGKRMADIAGKHEVIVSLEPLNSGECNFIHTVAEGGELVKRIDHPNFRLLADLYHMKMEDESPENLILYGDLLYHLHIAEKKGRSAPGVNGEDFTPYFNALRKSGYEGRISVECRWQNQEEEASVAIRAIRSQI